jgi:hypothetical protein
MEGKIFKKIKNNAKCKMKIEIEKKTIGNRR